MSRTEEWKANQAAGAPKDEMQLYLHDPSSRVLNSLLQNPNITEQEVVIIANRKNVAGDVLERIAKDKPWSESYAVRLALARNPRTPLFVSVSLARFLRVFDLEEITRSQSIPPVFRHKVEAMLAERIPTMPLGNKKTLAKKAAGRVLLKLLQDRIPEVVQLCLENPHMIEAHLYKVISRADTPDQTILMIAEHPLWSRRPLIRFALVRNAHTPLSVSVHFLKEMKLGDVRDLFNDPSLPVAVRPIVYRELWGRGVDPEKAGENEVYEVSEEEMDDAAAGAAIGGYEDPDEDSSAEEQD